MSSSNKKPRVSTDGSEVLFQLSAPTAVASDPTVVGSSSSDALKPKKSRTPKPKAVWEVTPEIQHGLDQFRLLFTATGAKLTKNAFIPHDLESPLHLLNTIVLGINPAALHIAGYVEAVHEILGGEIPAGRVKGLLLRLVAKEKAALKKDELNGMIEKLCADLKPLVVPCPDSMQPAYKAKAAAAAAASGSSAAIDTSLDQDTQEASRLSLDGLTAGDSVQAPSTGANATEPEYPHYAWYCKWNVPTRSQLMSVVQTTGDWVKLENSHREKLTAHNMRVMTENEVRASHFSH